MRKDSAVMVSFTRRFGFSLMEVVVAVLFFSLAAIPIYYSLSRGAARELETTRLAMARRILESFRNEVAAQDFEFIKNMAGGSTNFVAMASGGFQKTFTEVLEIQREYKDFEFTPLIRIHPSRDTVLEVKAGVTWTSHGNIQRAPEEIAFIVVKP